MGKIHCDTEKIYRLTKRIHMFAYEFLHFYQGANMKQGADKNAPQM